MAELNFKTKAQNLKNLQTKLKKAKILPLVLTSLEELILNEEKILSDIQALKANKLIIRSSSLSEDSMKNSNAGAFLSLANIDANSKDELLKALYKVANSMPSKSDEILSNLCLKILHFVVLVLASIRIIFPLIFVFNMMKMVQIIPLQMEAVRVQKLTITIESIWILKISNSRRL